ncbi:hypothetical protein SALBM135S_05931 [Streptomyces alboniger]
METDKPMCLYAARNLITAVTRPSVGPQAGVLTGMETVKRNCKF